MKKLLVLIVLIGAVCHFNPGLLPFLFASGAFDSEGNPEVLMFTVNGGGDICNSAALELKRRKVPFRELLLDGNEENEKLYQKLGHGGYPISFQATKKWKAHIKPRSHLHLEKRMGTDT